MPRLTNLEDVLFPVKECPVFVNIPSKSGEKSIPVPDKKAIVNVVTGRVLGLMSRDYRLVTNQEALEWAFHCCKTAFPETKPGEWEIKVVDAPSTGGHCFIDLVHNSTALDFEYVSAKDRPEVFGPFIRVINSYNGLRALAFEIGFYRKVCKNGMIVPRTIIRFHFSHLRKEIGETINFEIEHERLSKFKIKFQEYLGGLHHCPVSPSEFDPLVRGVLLIRKPENMEPYSLLAKDWAALSQHLDTLYNRYMNELGENAYAVFNAITEFASHPPDNRCVHRDRHSFQRLAGNWIGNFSQECRKPDFKISDYLERLTKNNGNGQDFLKTSRYQETW